jgi:hypothetical protein
MNVFLEVGTGFPFSTVQNAVNSALSGSTVRVNAGGVGNNYPEAILINNKRIRLFGALNNPTTGPVIGLTGAGAGAAPALQVAGTGGVHLEGFRCSNVGSAAADVIRGLVAQDWFSRLVVDGGGSKICLVGQYMDNLLLQNGTKGLVPSCLAQVIAQHVTVVNQSGWGLQGNAANGDFKGCLAYNCNGQAFLNALAQFCAWNFSDDPTAPGADSTPSMSLAAIAFINYAGGNFFLQPTSLAYALGVDFLPTDVRARRRMRSGPTRIYGGCFDPYPIPAAFLSGASQIRGV